MKLFKIIKNIFSLSCPECKGRLKNVFYDTEINHNVYECESCKKRFV